MAVCELISFRQASGEDISDAGTREKLHRIVQLLKASIGGEQHVHLFQQTEDPRVLYILCGWSSAAQRTEKSPAQSASYKEFEALLKETADSAGVTTSLIDVSVPDLPLNGPLMSIGYHTVPRRNKDGLERFFSGARHLLDEYATVEEAAVGGWVIENDDRDPTVWTLFAGWESWEQHFAFVKTEAFREYGKILGYLSGYESKHVRKVVLEEEAE